MVGVDQKMRIAMMERPEAFDPNVDSQHTQEMKEIIDQIGWPTFPKVGEQASGSAWLLVQHADHNVKFQKKCLGLMKKVPKGAIQKQNIAYLEDRVRVNQGRPQVYGTQFEKVGKHDCRPKTLEDPENVDQRRKSMGLGSLAEYKQQFIEFYKISK